MPRIRKPAGERRVNIGTSLSNEQDSLLSRFKQAYCWNHEKVPTEQEIREEVRPLIEQAIRAYIERAEADSKAKML